MLISWRVITLMQLSYYNSNFYRHERLLDNHLCLRKNETREVGQEVVDTFMGDENSYHLKETRIVTGQLRTTSAEVAEKYVV